MALKELDKKENVTEAPSNCNTSGAVWETGKRLFEYIRKQTLPDGTTGRVAFDEMGDRIYAEYQVVNVQQRHSKLEGAVVGYYNYSNVSLSIQNLRQCRLGLRFFFFSFILFRKKARCFSPWTRIRLSGPVASHKSRQA